MAKDRRARDLARNMMIAWASVLGCMVDVMRATGISNLTIHGFLDDLEQMHEECLDGHVLREARRFTAVVRRTVPGND